MAWSRNPRQTTPGTGNTVIDKATAPFRWLYTRALVVALSGFAGLVVGGIIFRGIPSDRFWGLVGVLVSSLIIFVSALARSATSGLAWLVLPLRILTIGASKSRDERYSNLPATVQRMVDPKSLGGKFPYERIDAARPYRPKEESSAIPIHARMIMNLFMIGLVFVILHVQDAAIPPGTHSLPVLALSWAGFRAASSRSAAGSWWAVLIIAALLLFLHRANFRRRIAVANEPYLEGANTYPKKLWGLVTFGAHGPSRLFAVGLGIALLADTIGVLTGGHPNGLVETILGWVAVVSLVVTIASALISSRLMAISFVVFSRSNYEAERFWRGIDGRLGSVLSTRGDLLNTARPDPVRFQGVEDVVISTELGQVAAGFEHIEDQLIKMDMDRFMLAADSTTKYVHLTLADEACVKRRRMLKASMGLVVDEEDLPNSDPSKKPDIKFTLAKTFSTKSIPYLQAISRTLGYTIIDYDLHSVPMTALVSAVTEAEASVYDRSAHLLGLNPWDFSLEIEWAENDEGDRDIHPLRFDVLKVKRAPVRGLTKDKRLPIWQGIVESLPGGSDGCKIEDDDVTGTAVVRYGKPLALPKDVRTIDLLPKYVDPMGWAKVTYGVGVDGRPIAIDLSKVPHVLIAGKPGSGKSTLLRTDTAVRLANGHKVVVLDHAKKAPWAVAFKPYTILWCTENRAIANALAFIYEESRRRGKLIREHGLENWYDFTLEERERFNIYPLSIYFDEYESAIDPKDLKTTELAYGKDSARYTADQRFNAAVGKIMTYMEQIGKEARYAGIFLVVSTQFPYANKLAGSRNVLGNTIQLAAPGTALQSSEIGLAMGSDTAETIELLTKYSRVRTGEKPPVGLSVIRDSENGTLAAMKIAYLEPADVVSTMKTLGVQECQPWRITDELGVGLRAEETPDPRQPIAPPVLKLTHLDEEAEDVIDLYSSQAASPAEQDSIDSDMDADQETADDPDAESGAPQHEAAEAPIGTAEPEAVLDAPVKSRWSRFQ